MFRLLAAHWKTLLLTDLSFKLLTFTLLAPTFNLLLGGMLAVRGRGVLTDVDILLFFASPLGVALLIGVIALWLGLLAMEQAALLAVLAAGQRSQRIGATQAIRFALTRFLPIIGVTAKLTAWTLLIIAPFALLTALVYQTLLGAHDINFYLSQRPLRFYLALLIACGLIGSLLTLLVRIHAVWFASLPVVLLENVPAVRALRVSRRRLEGRRWLVGRWLFAWLVAIAAANSLATGTAGAAAAAWIPERAGSLVVLATRTGLVVSLLAVVGLAIHIVGNISFAMVLHHVYRLVAPAAQPELVAVAAADFATPARRRFWRRWPRLLAAAACLALLVTLVGFWQLNAIELQDRAAVIAHRGASITAPENTLAAVRQAIDDRADWVEIDVQETADGHVVVVHDSDLMRLANNPIKIWQATLAELQQIDVGTAHDPKFAGEPVPTLAEVLQLCRDRAGVLIELKYYGHEQRLEERVVEVVEQCGMVDQVQLMSLKAAGVRKLRKLRPDWRCGLLLSAAVGNPARLDVDFIAVNSRRVSRRLVLRARQVGQQVFVWTVDDPEGITRMIRIGVDGVITNRPELMREILSQRASLSPGERALVDLADTLRDG